MFNDKVSHKKDLFIILNIIKQNLIFTRKIVQKHNLQSTNFQAV